MTSDPEPTEVMPTPSPVSIPISIVRIGPHGNTLRGRLRVLRLRAARTPGRQPPSACVAVGLEANRRRGNDQDDARGEGHDVLHGPAASEQPREEHPAECLGTEPMHIQPAIGKFTVPRRRCTTAPKGLVTAETTRSLPTAVSGGMPKKNTRIGVMSAPPPIPVSPTTTATANDAAVRVGLGSVMDVTLPWGQPATGAEQVHDGGHGVMAAQHRRVYHQVRVVRLFVRVGYAGKFSDRTRPRLGVQALAVSRLARFKWRGHVHEQEISGLFHHRTHLRPGRRIRRDRRADSDAVVARDLRCHEAYPRDVGVAVRAGEAKTGGKKPPDRGTIEQGDGSVSPFGKGVGEVAGDGGLAGTRQPGEEDDKPSLVPRWSRRPKLACHSRRGEPIGDLATLLKQRGELERAEGLLPRGLLDPRHRPPYFGGQVKGPLA